MTVVLFELDKGRQLSGHVGAAAMRRFMQQVAESVISHVRQSDLTFRYTGTSLAVLMGDTTADKVKPVVDKLRGTLAKLSLPGHHSPRLRRRRYRHRRGQSRRVLHRRSPQEGQRCRRPVAPWHGPRSGPNPKKGKTE
jgi:GGDEF domain-containing protein